MGFGKVKVAIATDPKLYAFVGSQPLDPLAAPFP